MIFVLPPTKVQFSKSVAFAIFPVKTRTTIVATKNSDFTNLYILKIYSLGVKMVIGFGYQKTRLNRKPANLHLSLN